ncbi:hypothetical protein vBBceHLY2_00061 [Bacillus phage vB_BceH_LY2]|nr:hypothetical protein vBBceHLY2_00061 [Bacillus phage vB_BceH_LY2]
MGNELKVMNENYEVRYILVLKYEEYSTKYTEIPLSYAPDEGLIKALLKLSKYHYAKVTQVSEEIIEYNYGEPEVQEVPKGTVIVNNYYRRLPSEELCTADPKDVAKVINRMDFEGINKKGDKF